MKRTLTALVLALAAIGLSTACAPTTSDVEDHALHEVAGGSTVPVSDLLTEEGAERFTIACPYETSADVAARLDVDAEAVPDLSDRDDTQAFVVVTTRGVNAAEFPRDRIDLCSAGESWPSYPGDADAALDVAQNNEDVYVVTR